MTKAGPPTLSKVLLVINIMMMYTRNMYMSLLLADGPEQLPLSSDCALNNGSLHVSAVAAVINLNPQDAGRVNPFRAAAP